MLRVEKLSAYYGPVQILHDIDITVAAGEIVGLVGANAAGKSTLMFSLAGLRTRATGGIFIGDARVDALARLRAGRCTAWCWCPSGGGCSRS